MSEEDIASFDSMTDKKPKIKESETAAPSCPFSSGNQKLPPFGGDASPMPSCPFAGAFDGFGEGAVDHSMINMALLSIIDALEGKIEDVMEVSQSGICPAIHPIDIFFNEKPYLMYEELMEENEGLSALRQLKQLRTNVESQGSLNFGV